MRGIRIGLTVLALSMLTAVISISPASAAHKDGRCEVGEYCGYQNIYYSGGWIDYYYEDDNYLDDRFLLVGAIVDNQISSLITRDEYHWLYLYRHPGFSDLKMRVFPGNPSSVENLWPCCNDMISSHSWS